LIDFDHVSDKIFCGWLVHGFVTGIGLRTELYCEDRRNTISKAMRVA
jgi:hypothetical protein